MGNLPQNKIVLRIMLDFIAGPLWKDVFDVKSNNLVAGIKIIDEDSELNKIGQEIQNLYSSYYKFDYKDKPVYFDYEQEKKDKEKMLSLLKQLNNRISELNDGSFVVEDLETPRVEKL